MKYDFFENRTEPYKQAEIDAEYNLLNTELIKYKFYLGVLL
jgi:hypothetical protein